MWPDSIPAIVASSSGKQIKSINKILAHFKGKQTDSAKGLKFFR